MPRKTIRRRYNDLYLAEIDASDDSMKSYCKTMWSLTCDSSFERFGLSNLYVNIVEMLGIYR